MTPCAFAAGDTITLGLPKKSDVLLLGQDNLPDPVTLDLGKLRSTEGELPLERSKFGKSNRSGSYSSSKSNSSGSNSSFRRRSKKPTITPDNLPPSLANLPVDEQLSLSDLPNYGQDEE